MKKLCFVTLCALLFLATGCQKDMQEPITPERSPSLRTRADDIPLILRQICNRENSTLTDQEYMTVLELLADLMERYPGFGYVIDLIAMHSSGVSFHKNSGIRDDGIYDPNYNSITFKQMPNETYTDVLFEEIIHAAQRALLSRDNRDKASEIWESSLRDIEFEAKATMDCLKWKNGETSLHGVLGMPNSEQYEYLQFIRNNMFYLDNFIMLSGCWQGMGYEHLPHNPGYFPTLLGTIFSFP